MSALAKRFFTPEEYLLLENQAAYKSQYIAGEIYALAGADPVHIEIVQNLVAALLASIGERPGKVYSTDMRVRAESSRDVHLSRRGRALRRTTF